MSGVVPDFTGRYPTPDANPVDTLCRVLSVPNDLRIIAAVNEVLSLLINPDVWEEVGLTPDETSWLVADMLNAFWESECEETPMSSPHQVGDIFPSMRQYQSSEYRLADGSIVSKSTYPDLAAIIDPAYDRDAWTIQLPDLRGRTPIGSGAGPGLTPRSINDSDGKESVSLTLSTLPEHVHTYPEYDNTQPYGEYSKAVAGWTPYWGNRETSVEGDGLPHWNMQPYVAVQWWIYMGTYVE